MAAPVIAETLTYVYNLCIDNVHFPIHLQQIRVIHLCSYQMALINLVDRKLHNINEKKKSGALVHFEKAFGVIDHGLLYIKLLLYPVPDQCRQLITPFLMNQNHVACGDRSKPNIYQLKYGVSRDFVLGFILELIYLNVLPIHIPELCEHFCNDTTIHTSHYNLSSVFKSLQNCFNKLTTWPHFNHVS